MPPSLLVSKTAASTGIHGVGLVLRMIFMLVLVREASPAVLGFFGLLTAIDTITIYIAGFELHTFSTRRYARHATPSQLRISFGVHLRVLRYSAPLAAVIAMGSAWVFDVEFDSIAFLCFGVVAATGAVAQEIARYLVIIGKPIRSITVGFLRSAGWMPAAMFALGTDQESMRNITIAWAAASAIAMGWGLHALRSAVSWQLRMRARYVRLALKRSLNYYAVATASVVQSNIDRFILQVMLGPVAVGIYSLFASLANAMSALVQAGVLNIFLPRLLTAFGSLSAQRRAVLKEAMSRALIVSVVMGAVIFVAAVPIVRLTEHTDYLRYLWILPALLAGQVFLMWTQPVHLALYSAHHDRLLLTMTLIFLVVSLAISATLIGIVGVVGAALAPAVVNLSLACARWRAFARLEARGRV